MSEFNINSESIDVERIMQQVRSRIKEKRGQDYTEAEIRKLANVKLERFLNPHDVRSDLVKHYRQQQNQEEDSGTTIDPNDFDVDTIYRSSRPGLSGKLLFFIRKRLNFILKFFVNPVPITDALHSQHQLNQLNFELMNNLVVEMTRLAIEMKNLKMRVESIAARLEFDERRARAFEGVVQYREDNASTRADASKTTGEGSSGGTEKKRRRRRRGRRRSGSAPTSASVVSSEASNQSPVDNSQTKTDQPHTGEQSSQILEPKNSDPVDKEVSPVSEKDHSSDEEGSQNQ